jgi:hypothetical protein
VGRTTSVCGRDLLSDCKTPVCSVTGSLGVAVAAGGKGWLAGASCVAAGRGSDVGSASATSMKSTVASTRTIRVTGGHETAIRHGPGAPTVGTDIVGAAPRGAPFQPTSTLKSAWRWRDYGTARACSQGRPSQNISPCIRRIRPGFRTGEFLFRTGHCIEPRSLAKSAHWHGPCAAGGARSSYHLILVRRVPHFAQNFAHQHPRCPHETQQNPTCEVGFAGGEPPGKYLIPRRLCPL